jgi:hypothetical protein
MIKRHGGIREKMQRLHQEFVGVCSQLVLMHALLLRRQKSWHGLFEVSAFRRLDHSHVLHLAGNASCALEKSRPRSIVHIIHWNS